MSQAKHGDTVHVHYTGTLADGSEFDSSRGGDPLQFKLGDGEVIPGFENAVMGMATGDVKTVTIPAAEAYGPRRDQLTEDVPRNAIPDDIALSDGMVLYARSPEGETFPLTVVAFDDDKVTVDRNHPLAGQDLTFALELVAVA